MVSSLNKWLSQFEFIICIYAVCFLNTEWKMCGVELYAEVKLQAFLRDFFWYLEKTAQKGVTVAAIWNLHPLADLFPSTHTGIIISQSRHAITQRMIKTQQQRPMMEYCGVRGGGGGGREREKINKNNNTRYPLPFNTRNIVWEINCSNAITVHWLVFRCGLSYFL